MTLGDLIKILSTTSIPTTYRAFKEGKSPGLPFICIVDADTDNFLQMARYGMKFMQLILSCIRRAKI